MGGTMMAKEEKEVKKYCKKLPGDLKFELCMLRATFTFNVRNNRRYFLLLFYSKKKIGRHFVLLLKPLPPFVSRIHARGASDGGCGEKCFCPFLECILFRPVPG